MNHWFRVMGLGLGLVLAACQVPMASPGGHGTVRISFQTPGRTVVADWSKVVDHYAVILTNAATSEQKAGTGASGASSVIVDSVGDGTWNVRAEAYNNSNPPQQVGSGTGSVIVSPGSSPTVNIAMTTSQLGTGAFVFNFAVPASRVYNVYGELYRGGNLIGNQVFANLSLVGTNYEGSFSNASLGYPSPNLASGAYVLKLFFYNDDGAQVAAYGEAVNVWDNATSDAWLDPSGHLTTRRVFTEAEFAPSSNTLAGLSVTSGGAPLITTFAPFQASYDVSSAGNSFDLTPTAGLSGQTIQYSQDGAGWTTINSGETRSFSFTTATKVSLLVTATDGGTRTYTVNAWPQVALLADNISFEPIGITGDAAGNLYVAESSGHTIKKFDSAGHMTTLAGSGQPGSSDSTDPLAATFNKPYGITVDDAGNLYMTEYDGGNIRKISPSGAVTTVLSGLNLASGIVVTHGGSTLYFSNRGNSTIERLDLASGARTVVAYLDHNPDSVALNSTETTLYVGANGDGTVHKIDLINDAFTDTVILSLDSSYPYGVAVDPDENVYVCLLGYKTIVKISATNTAPIDLLSSFTRVAGNGSGQGAVDGPGQDTQVIDPNQIFRAASGPSAGTFYFTERGLFAVGGQSRIRSFR